MSPDIFRQRLQAFEPIVFNIEGGIRVLEKSSQVAVDLRDGTAVGETLVAEIEAILTGAQASDRQPHVRFQVRLIEEILSNENIDDAVSLLLMAHGGLAEVTIYFAHSPSDFTRVRRFVSTLRAKVGRPQEVGIVLSAPFSRFDQAEMEPLFDQGVRIRFAAGWTPACRPGEMLCPDPEVVRQFSEFGFRTIIEWFVHSKNISSFESQIGELLIANFNSGFSLPLICESPYYTFGPEDPELPKASDYCKLLVQSYNTYPYYDDVLAPLTQIALLIKNGGWNATAQLPAAINITLSEGQVGLSCQAPSLRTNWMSVPDLLKLEPGAVSSQFLAFAASTFVWDHIPFCRGCEWKYTCGGLGPTACSRLNSEELDTMCSYRKLFLQHFATNRWSEKVSSI